MKKLFSIKWELIIAILLGITTLISWSIYQSDLKDWRMVVLTIIPTILFIVWIICYSQIKEFRLTVKSLW